MTKRAFPHLDVPRHHLDMKDLASVTVQVLVLPDDLTFRKCQEHSFL